MKNTNFYICRHCGNIITKLTDSTVAVKCCGEVMQLLEAGTVEASREKHLPAVTVSGNTVTVAVGTVLHPMAEEHHIEWVYLETDKGGAFKYLEVGASPEVTFTVADEKPVAVYAWCNLHGLWKTEI